MVDGFEKSAELIRQISRLTPMEDGDYSLAGYRTLRALGETTLLSDIRQLEHEARRVQNASVQQESGADFSEMEVLSGS